jgi:hypothetical protein
MRLISDLIREEMCPKMALKRQQIAAKSRWSDCVFCMGISHRGIREQNPKWHANKRHVPNRIFIEPNLRILPVPHQL